LFVYYESRKRELVIRLMKEGRCDERLKARVEESTCLTYTFVAYIACELKIIFFNFIFPPFSFFLCS
jgi:hypothetical protein